MGFQPNRRFFRKTWRGWQVASGFMLVALFSAGATPCGQSQQNASTADTARATPASATPAPAEGKPSPANPHEKQLADQNAQLLKLATELKVEVDKTSKDTLSLAVIRKADAVERAAREVKEKYRADAGAN